MTSREAIRVLMLQPLYFRLDQGTRKMLVDDLCEEFATGREFLTAFPDGQLFASAGKRGVKGLLQRVA